MKKVTNGSRSHVKYSYPYVDNMKKYVYTCSYIYIYISMLIFQYISMLIFLYISMWIFLYISMWIFLYIFLCEYFYIFICEYFYIYFFVYILCSNEVKPSPVLYSPPQYPSCCHHPSLPPHSWRHQTSPATQRERTQLV